MTQLKPFDRLPGLTCIAMVFLLSCTGGCTKKGPQDYQSSISNPFKQDRYEKLLERQQASMPPELDAKKVPEMTGADHERLGDAHFTEGKLEMAYLQYSKALQKNPDNTTVLCKRGLIFLRKGMIDAAMKDFQTVLGKDPAHALAHQGMGQALLKMKNYVEAEKHFQQAIKSNPKLWASYNFLGIMYDYQQQHVKAVDIYKAGINVKQDEATLYNNLGVSYSLMGENEKAVEAFRQGLSISPRDRKIGNNLGMVLCKLGRHLEALEAFKSSGDDAQAFNNLGCFYLEEGDYEKAIRAFERAIQLRQDQYPQASDNLKKAKTALQASSGEFGPGARKANPRKGAGGSSDSQGPMHIEIKEAP